MSESPPSPTTTKIIVLDDDPTGSQTVHSCYLLTQWNVPILQSALQDDSPLFFILTNTRGMSADRAARITREVCRNLKLALAQFPHLVPTLVSRSDSTLRGHYPVEPNVMAEELGPLDAHFLVPAFFEGGRITKNSTHYLQGEDGTWVPCHETEFAKDSVFGYSTAYLPDYVQEKTQGKILASSVERFVLDDVRGDCTSRLQQLKDNVCCVVDAETPEDLTRFCVQIAKRQGRRLFLFRSAASLLTALARLPPQPVAAHDMHRYVPQKPRRRPGAIVVGSHVQKTTLQLKELLALNQVEGIEVTVERLRAEGTTLELLDEILTRAFEIHKRGRHVAIYTSRNELAFGSIDDRLHFGEKVSSFLMQVVQGLPPTIGFLISKGGITSNDVLSVGLALDKSRVLGQILPGCSVVRCPADHPRYPEMPVVIFPGNVGDANGLVTTLQRLSPAGDGSQ